MVELSDKEIEELLQCLDKHGFEYNMSRNEMKKIIKNNIDKDLIKTNKFDKKYENVIDTDNIIKETLNNEFTSEEDYSNKEDIYKNRKIFLRN